MWFERDEAGDVDRLLIRQGMTFEAPRKGTPREAEVREANRPDPDRIGKYLGTYHDDQRDIDVEIVIDRDYLALRAPEQTFHLWNVPGTEIWQVREAPSSRITFQEEEGETVSFSREAPGVPKLVAMRVH